MFLVEAQGRNRKWAVVDEKDTKASAIKLASQIMAAGKSIDARIIKISSNGTGEIIWTGSKDGQASK